MTQNIQQLEKENNSIFICSLDRNMETLMRLLAVQNKILIELLKK